MELPSTPTKEGSMTRPRTASLVGAAPLAATLLATSAASADTHRVFTSTNEAAGNRVLVYDRAAHGALEPVGSVATGGLGTGGGLSNQGAVQAAGGLLFVADAGSDDVAVLRRRARQHGLERRDAVRLRRRPPRRPRRLRGRGRPRRHERRVVLSPVVRRHADDDHGVGGRP